MSCKKQCYDPVKYLIPEPGPDRPLNWPCSKPIEERLIPSSWPQPQSLSLPDDCDIKTWQQKLKEYKNQIGEIDGSLYDRVTWTREIFAQA